MRGSLLDVLLRILEEEYAMQGGNRNCPIRDGGWQAGLQNR